MTSFSSEMLSALTTSVMVSMVTPGGKVTCTGRMYFDVQILNGRFLLNSIADLIFTNINSFLQESLILHYTAYQNLSQRGGQINITHIHTNCQSD